VGDRVVSLLAIGIWAAIAYWLRTSYRKQQYGEGVYQPHALVIALMSEANFATRLEMPDMDHHQHVSFSGSSRTFMQSSCASRSYPFSEQRFGRARTLLDSLRPKIPRHTSRIASGRAERHRAQLTLCARASEKLRI
jgi:hypothetical protein